MAVARGNHVVRRVTDALLLRPPQGLVSCILESWLSLLGGYVGGLLSSVAQVIVRARRPHLRPCERAIHDPIAHACHGWCYITRKKNAAVGNLVLAYDTKPSKVTCFETAFVVCINIHNAIRRLIRPTRDQRHIVSRARIATHLEHRLGSTSDSLVPSARGPFTHRVQRYHERLDTT